eukprot:2391291-Amphidinium_carterae.1
MATASAPKPVPMDLGYIPWSNKGKGKDGKDKGYKGGSKWKGDKGSWYNQQGGKGGKGKSKDKSGNGKGSGGGKMEEETPSGGDTPRDGIDQTVQATDE